MTERTRATRYVERVCLDDASMILDMLGLTEPEEVPEPPTDRRRAVPQHEFRRCGFDV